MFEQASADYVLTTTRSVRKRLDLRRSVPRNVLEECLRIAIQAPTGGNRQGWRFIVVQDAEKRRQIGNIYKRSFAVYLEDRQVEWAQHEGSYGEQMQRVAASAIYLNEVMGEVPAMVIPCIYGRVETADQLSQAGLYGSILPAAWSLMLALRARGLGSAWTTLHLRYAAEVAELLGIPDDVTQAALLPIAYFTGETFRPAKRMPIEEVTFWDGWG